MKTASDGDDTWRTALWWVSGVGLLFSLVTLPVYGLGFAASVALGSAISVGNLWLIARGVRTILTGGPTGRYWLAFVLKFSVVIAGAYLLFDSRLAQGLPLLLGLVALPIGIVLSQLSAVTSPQKGR